MNYRIWQQLLVLALSFASSEKLFAAGPVVLAESISVNDTVTGSVKIGRRVIALPKGNWQLAIKSEKNSSSDGTSQMPVIMTLYFQEIINGRLNRALELAATKYSGRINWLDEPCKLKNDSYWIEDRKRSFNDQFCLRVGYLSGVVDGARGDAYQLWARTIKDRSIGYSPEMPFVSVIRFTSYDYLRMVVSFDPSVSGVHQSANSVRQFNDWQGQTVSSRALHARFYDSLVSWAPGFATAVQRAFDGDQYLSDTDFGEPSLPRKVE